jgi:hypothetical protein
MGGRQRVQKAGTGSVVGVKIGLGRSRESMRIRG